MCSLRCAIRAAKPSHLSTGNSGAHVFALPSGKVPPRGKVEEKLRQAPQDKKGHAPDQPRRHSAQSSAGCPSTGPGSDPGVLRIASGGFESCHSLTMPYNAAAWLVSSYDCPSVAVSSNFSPSRLHRQKKRQLLPPCRVLVLRRQQPCQHLQQPYQEPVSLS